MDVSQKGSAPRAGKCVAKEVGVRSANSKPELSQLLFISVRQRELVKSSHWIGLSTYTSVTWSVHYLPTLPCDHVM